MDVNRLANNYLSTNPAEIHSRLTAHTKLNMRPKEISISLYLVLMRSCLEYMASFALAPHQLKSDLKPENILCRATKMFRIPENMTYKMMLWELELFSLVKMWLGGDKTQILTTWGAVTKMQSLNYDNITKVHHHKLHTASLRLDIRKTHFPMRGEQCVTTMLRNIPYLEIFRTPAELAVVFMAQEAGAEHFHRSIFPRIFVCKIINWKKLYRFTAIKEVYASEKCCFLEDKAM